MSDDDDDDDDDIDDDRLSVSHRVGSWLVVVSKYM